MRSARITEEFIAGALVMLCRISAAHGGSSAGFVNVPPDPVVREALASLARRGHAERNPQGSGWRPTAEGIEAAGRPS